MCWSGVLSLPHFVQSGGRLWWDFGLLMAHLEVINSTHCFLIVLQILIVHEKIGRPKKPFNLFWQDFSSDSLRLCHFCTFINVSVFTARTSVFFYLYMMKLFGDVFHLTSSPSPSPCVDSTTPPPPSLFSLFYFSPPSPLIHLPLLVPSTLSTHIYSEYILLFPFP